MSKLSVLIPSFNSEKTIRETLESVKWADEIFVCDSFSTDKTLAIAREYAARIIQHEYINSALQKNWAIPQCRHEWVLIVDTDEVLEDGLKEEIFEKIEKNDPAFDGFMISGKNLIYGQWIRYGGLYPDYHLRLIRRDKGRYATREVHAHLLVPGKIGKLKHHFLHNGFKDMSTWLIKLARYSKYEADELAKQGKKFHFMRVTLYPFIIFMRTYFWKLAILEGYRGFMLSLLDSFYYFNMYAKLYERQRTKQL